MPNATFIFPELDLPSFHIFITGYGEPDYVRKFLRAATHKRNILVRSDIEQFIPFVIRELMRHTCVKITGSSNFAELTYIIAKDPENGAPHLRIARQSVAIHKRNREEYVKHETLYHGFFFKWLRNRESSGLRRPGRPKGTTKEMLRQKRLDLELTYNKQHADGQNRYTKEQRRLQKEYLSLIEEQQNRREGQERRHETKLKIRKLSADFMPEDDLQPKPRRLTVDFSGVNSLDHDPDGYEHDDEVLTPNR